jgi:hypothetical protein
VPGGPGSAIEVVENHYKVALGNDHYIDLLPFGIPIALR